jgi:hypothetical protein
MQPPEHALVAKVSVPGGFKAVWEGDDPTESSDAVIHPQADGSYILEWPAGIRGARNVWLVPNAELQQSTSQLRIDVKEGPTCHALSADPERPAAPNTDRVLIASTRLSQRTLEVGFGIVPIPADGQMVLSTAGGETAALIAMGYQVADAEGRAPQGSTDLTFPACTPVVGVAAPPPGKQPEKPTEKPAP